MMSSFAHVLATTLLMFHQSCAFVTGPAASALQSSRNLKTARSSSFTRMSASYSPKTVGEAWDNHLASFGGQDVDKILLDYDENSVITTYDLGKNEKKVFTGVEGARSLFSGLFPALHDLSDLDAPVADVSEESKMVFLIWRCPASGFVDATDTFVFGDNNKIYRQNVAYKTA